MDVLEIVSSDDDTPGPLAISGSPLGMPDMEEDEDDLYIDDLPLPTNDNTTEFKPLIRSMNEFKFW